MSDVAQVLEAVKGLKDDYQNLSSRLDQVQKENEEARRASPFGAPNVRRGENTMSSRGYSYLKALGLMAGHLRSEDCTVEVETSNKLKRYFDGYGFKKSIPNSVLLPIWSEALVGEPALAQEVKQVTKAGYSDFDLDQYSFIRKKMFEGGYERALSWLDNTAGEALVGPPMFGELIELLRNNLSIMRAGARVLPMPATGRLVLPRQTSAATAYHVGESVNITESQQGTGDVTLQAKKLGVLTKIPNELFHFASIPIEGFVREDLVQVVSLKMDKTLLEDVGSSTIPKGLINYSGITSHTSTDPGTTTDGYKFQPRDVWQMIAKVEEKNATFRAFIGRPLLYASLVNDRADAITAGDKKGSFLFNIVREPSADMGAERLNVGNLSGYPFYKTNQVSITRARGSSTDLTYLLGGDFNDFLVALSGALEFAVSREGDTPFVADQTWFRGTLYYDGMPRHEASFVLCDQLYQSF